MKKKILWRLSLFIIAVVFLINFSLATNRIEPKFQSIISLGYVALADSECGENSLNDCPGGSCFFNYANGDCCEACCPEGKSPTCGSTGCTCF